MAEQHGNPRTEGQARPLIPAPSRVARRMREDFGGDPACWLNRVCSDCGRFVEDQFADFCPYCEALRDEPSSDEHGAS